MTKDLAETVVVLYRHTIHDRRNRCHVAGSASAGIVVVLFVYLQQT